MKRSFLGGCLLAAALTVLSCGTAMAAAPPPGAPSAADISAAGASVAQPATYDRLARFFVRLDRHQAGRFTSGEVSESAAAAKAPQLTGSVHPVYSLSPEFVRGDANAPVASFAYLATGARSATGQQASLWLEKNARGAWEIVNIVSSPYDATYPAQAGTGQVFTEPQIHAWYRLAGDRVTPLNPEATASVGAAGLSLAEYQALVHGRYADKQAGSAYQQEGKLGGFSTTPDTPSPAPAILAGALLAAGLTAGIAITRNRRTPEESA
ncbi:hypothetical protein DP939_07760 [Spongiactinospora rosea]|uniref:Uncharacterized protein n=1 Tax=Spongiactinospora rosea TaxID=2248750 RepID=A0A366M5E7_9ACTN|nr:hypothetical protein [Spongiactinospora rosea]RBQ20950.1 hypothetical protein DP939_07760 [Spongiactinospora rosea]